MKKNIILFVLLCMLYAWKLHSQVNATIPQSFNTAVNNSYNGLIPSFPAAGCNDLSWWVSNSGPLGTYIPAIHYNGNTFSAGPWAVSSAWDPSDWITKPNYNCGPNPTAHNCVPGNQDLYYRITFTLATTAFAVNWELYADDKIVDVWVNGAPVWTPNGGGYAHNNMISFKWCSGWRLGANDIIVHTLSTNGLTGLKVTSGATATLSISGNSPVCKNSSNLYTVTANPAITATSYSWTLPSLWGGFSNTSIINAVANGGTGALHAAAYSGTACLGITSKTIVVMPLPTVNIVPSSPSVCPGNTVQLTGNGAVSYTWLPVTGLPGGSIANSVTVSPGTGNSYTLIGIAANGCTASITKNIGFLPVPVVFITPQPAFICPNLSNTLTATGAATYTWNIAPGSPTNNPLVTQLNPPQTLSVSGTNSLGCIGNSTISLSAGTLIPVSASNTILCTDVAPCTNISASTSFTGWPPVYTWQPGNNLTGQTISVCPTITTIYNVTANSPVLCPNTVSLAVTVQTCCPPSTATFALPSVTSCNMSYTNLAQYSSTAGIFSGAGVTFTNGQYNFNQFHQLTTAGVYTITLSYTTAPYGCTYTIDQFVTIYDPLPMAVSNPTSLCHNGLGANISATLSSPPSSGTYTWQPGNIVGQTALVTPMVPTIYTVSANGNVFGIPCVSTNTVAVSLIYTCCPQSSVVPLIGTNFLTAPGSLSGPLLIDQNITIGGSGNFTLQTGDFIMGTAVKITVLPGVNLVLSDAHFYSCGIYMWRGIEVINGGNVTSAPGPNGLSTLIEDAEIAIDVDNIGPGHAVPLLYLEEVVFNRNDIGIKLHNSPLTTIHVLVKSCVFTARDLPCNTLSWPGASLNFPDLRSAVTGATNSLNPPYIMNPSYPQGIFKMFQVYRNWAWIGICIDNIGNVQGAPPTGGVELTSWSVPTSNEFNLFDRLNVGIDVTDASLTTHNNTFQNVWNYGIADTINSLMNARLSLTPQSFANPSTENRFWNCTSFAIQCINVFDIDIEKAIVRSGYYGFKLISNRFSYRLRHNSFGNVKFPIDFELLGGAYNLNGLVQNGIYADSLIISQNYFGKDIAPNTLYNPSSFLGTAIFIRGENNSVWNIQTPNNFIQSNIIDKARSGIAIWDMSNYPLEISNNYVKLDFLPPTGIATFGVWLSKNLGSKVVNHNMVTSAAGGGNGHGSAACIAATDNIDPIVNCNNVEYNWTGFHFFNNTQGSWLGNTMFSQAIGLKMGDQSALAPQGNINMACGNQWLGNAWGSGPWETYFETNTNFFNPPTLYVNPGYPYQPTNNSSPAFFLNTYNTPGNLVLTNAAPFSCPTPTFPPFPMQAKSAAPLMTRILQQEARKETEAKVFPNPSSGIVTIVSDNETEQLNIKLFDVSGKEVYTNNVTTNNSQFIIDLSVTKGIYLIEIQGENKRKRYKKLIIE